jgi:hypothetical protein
VKAAQRPAEARTPPVRLRIITIMLVLVGLSTLKIR